MFNFTFNNISAISWRYILNIVESGVKHHKPNPNPTYHLWKCHQILKLNIIFIIFWFQSWF